MAKSAPDDLEAVRTVAEVLQGFEALDQERILRWAREKLGLSPVTTNVTKDITPAEASVIPPVGKSSDIKTFIEFKKPQSDSQFVAAVAYFYRFEAPEPQRKASISAADLQEACRQTGRERLTRPAQTLVNSHNQGYMDKGAERGSYVLNTVGENLVAMALPEGNRTQAKPAARRKNKPTVRKGLKKTGKKKTT